MLYFLGSCGIKKNSSQENDILQKNPKLIFLNYSISKKENGEKKVQFINKIITNGKLKKISNNYLKTPEVGDLKCSQLDKNSNLIQNIFLKNPLNKVIEFVNDSLSFEKKQVALQKTTLSFRLQLNNNIKYIVLSEIIDSLQHTKTLVKTEL